MLGVEDAMYPAPPTTPIPLEKLEDAVKRRVQLLLAVYRGTLSSSTIALIDPLTDVHAHFGLRVIFASPPHDGQADASDTDLSVWYIDQETKLFRHRVMHMLKRSNPSAARIIVHDALRASNISYDEAPDGKHILVPFQDVPFLIRTRSIVLHAGYCRVPFQSNEASLVLAHHAHHQFKSMLRIQARACRVHRHDLERLYPLRSYILAVLRDALRPVDPRLHQLTHLPRVTCDDDLRAAAPFLPMCMRHLASKLRESRHLKYDGRRQLGLFLKGVGFTVEENLLFWRTAFHPLTTAKTFDKKYAYNIRHSYGLEGSRVVYDPKTCDGIQKHGPPSAGQFHGCPFLHWDRASLRTRLVAHGVPGAADIAAMTSPTAACLAHLHAAFPAAASFRPDDKLLTPNLWFDVARMSGSGAAPTHQPASDDRVHPSPDSADDDDVDDEE